MQVYFKNLLFLFKVLQYGLTISFPWKLKKLLYSHYRQCSAERVTSKIKKKCHIKLKPKQRMIMIAEWKLAELYIVTFVNILFDHLRISRLFWPWQYSLNISPRFAHGSFAFSFIREGVAFTYRNTLYRCRESTCFSS